MNQAFYFDVVCPYAYMAFTILHRARVLGNQRMSVKPILLGGLFKEMAVPSDPNRTLSQARSDYLREDIARQAVLFSIPLKFHPRHPVNTVAAMRLITACDEDIQLAVTNRIYQDYWQHGRDIDDERYLDAIKAEFHINSEAIGFAKDQLRAQTHEAFTREVFGVPTIIIDNKRYFGADRLVLIDKELGITIDDTPWSTGEPIDFYFDFSSPYSYLGYGEVRKAQAQGVQFNFKPILAGALFKAIGTNDIPMLTAHPHKASYYLQDMQDWARYRDMPFIFNTHFPLRSVTALRVALCEPRMIGPIYQAAWAMNLDIGDDGVLETLAKNEGFGQDNLLARAQDEPIKNALKENTASAVERGIFGVPTFFVNGHKVFGQDRFLWMRREILNHRSL